MKSPLEHCHQPGHACHVPAPTPSSLISCISMEQLPDKSDRILQKVPTGPIITINITSLSSHRPFFRGPSRLASLIVMTALFFLPSHMGLMKHSGFPEVTQQDRLPTRSFHTAWRINDVAELSFMAANKNTSVALTKDFLIKQQNPFSVLGHDCVRDSILVDKNQPKGTHLVIFVACYP